VPDFEFLQRRFQVAFSADQFPEVREVGAYVVERNNRSRNLPLEGDGDHEEAQIETDAVYVMACDLFVRHCAGILTAFVILAGAENVPLVTLHDPAAMRPVPPCETADDVFVVSPETTEDHVTPIPEEQIPDEPGEAVVDLDMPVRIGPVDEQAAFVRSREVRSMPTGRGKRRRS
jgi:hypothetical protein